jgi:hypothetical protein
MEGDLLLNVSIRGSHVPYEQRSAREHPEHFVSLRRAHVVFLHSVLAAAAVRTGRHPEMGPVNVSHLLHQLANHDLGHLCQMAELIEPMPSIHKQDPCSGILNRNHEQ